MPRIVFDSETGAPLEMPADGIARPAAAVIASSLLPGTTPELVASWYVDYLEHDMSPEPRDPWAVGADVALAGRTDWRGRVVDVRKLDGIAHSIRVVWTGRGSGEWYSPSELVAVLP